MCIVALKSMTQAIKAKKALNDSYIDAEIVKLEANMTKKGCAYGIEFNCVNLEAVQTAFRSRYIKYTELIRT